MLIERARLQNIKCFEDTEFSFVKEDGSIAKWVTLLGENATGKTTALQALAILIAGVEQAPSLLPRPAFWLRDENRFGALYYKAKQDNGEEAELECLATGSQLLESPTLKDINGKPVIYNQYLRQKSWLGRPEWRQ